MSNFESQSARLLEHGGTELGFKSDLRLIPESGVGYFVSTNADLYGEGISEFENQLFYEFMKSFFPTNIKGLIQYPVYLPSNDELKVEASGDQLLISIGNWSGVRFCFW